MTQKKMINSSAPRRVHEKHFKNNIAEIVVQKYLIQAKAFAIVA